MIRGLVMARRDWIMLALSSKRAPLAWHAREHIMGVVADIGSGSGALKPGGAGLILGMGRAICRAPRLCRIIG